MEQERQGRRDPSTGGTGPAQDVPCPVPSAESESGLVFADDHARLSHTIRKAVDCFNVEHPKGYPALGVNRSYWREAIQFDPEYAERGEIALFWADDFMHSECDPAEADPEYERPPNTPSTLYHVQPRTVQLLDSLRIPYRRVLPDSPASGEVS
jgi:hypothetical protein